jgi:putative nucleotidyltransferase with HDIG domain
MSVDPKSLKAKVKGLKSVPTLPGVFEKVSALVEDPDTGAEDIAAVISSDQALSAKILRVVNSALHGFPGRISSVTHALIILGFDVVQGLVLTTSVFDMMISKGMHGLWAHSLGCAVTAGVIARKVEYPHPEEISIAALLHDIGKVIMKTEIPNETEQVVALVKAKDISVREAEEEVLGLTHTTVGRWISEEWNLPHKLTEPIRYHHNPTLSKVAEVPTAIVHVANSFVKANGFGSGGDDLVPPIHPKAWDRLNISDALLEEIVREMTEQLLDAEEFLSSGNAE